MANSWMKDYYDIWTLCREFAFDGEQKFPRPPFQGNFKPPRIISLCFQPSVRLQTVA